MRCDLGGAQRLVGDAVDDVRFGIGAVVGGVVVEPCDRHALGVQRGAEMAGDVGAVVVVLHVLVAGVDQLHRRAGHRHRGAHGLVEEVEKARQPAAEAAAHRQQVEGDLLDRQVRDLGAEGARAEAVLGAGPHFQRAVLARARWRSSAPSAHGRDTAPCRSLRRRGRAASASAPSPLVMSLVRSLPRSAAVWRAAICAEVTAPLPASSHLGSSAATASRARQKRSATTTTASSSFTTFLMPRRLIDAAGIDGLQLAAEHRRDADRGVEHARLFDVEAVVGRAVDLLRDVDARDRLCRPACTGSRGFSGGLDDGV